MVNTGTSPRVCRGWVPDHSAEWVATKRGRGATHLGRASAGQTAGGATGWDWVAQWMPPPPEAMLSIRTWTTVRPG